jgi:hypothetical protein
MEAGRVSQELLRAHHAEAAAIANYSKQRMLNRSPV